MNELNTYIVPKNIADPSQRIALNVDVKKTAQEFEAMFIAEMFRPVFDSMDVDPVFGGGQSEKIYQSMLVDEYGKKISQAGGIGLAEVVEKELIKLQEIQQNR